MSTFTTGPLDGARFGARLHLDGAVHAADAALPAGLKARIDGLQGLHVKPRTGRSEPAVHARESPRPLAPHEQPQPQPVVRIHPVTGERALFLSCARRGRWTGWKGRSRA